MKRKDGYYWLTSERASEPGIAQLSGDRWFTIGEAQALTTSALKVRGWDIGDRIVHPDYPDKKKYVVRVTREPDGETADFEVEARNWENAKLEACAQAAANPESFFPQAQVEYTVAAEDDDEEAAELEDE